MSDAIEVEIEDATPIPLRYQLVMQLSLSELQSMARDRGLGGAIARATKHELATRLASNILAQRLMEHEAQTGPLRSGHAAARIDYALPRAQKRWEEYNNEVADARVEG